MRLERLEKRWKVLIVCGILIVVFVGVTIFVRQGQLARLETEQKKLKKAEARYKELDALRAQDQPVRQELADLEDLTRWILRVSPEAEIPVAPLGWSSVAAVAKKDYMPRLLENLDELANMAHVEIKAVTPKAYELRKTTPRPKADDPKDAKQVEEAERKFKNLPKQQQRVIEEDEAYLRQQGTLNSFTDQVLVKIELRGRLRDIYYFITGLAYRIGPGGPQSWRFPQLIAIRNLAITRPARGREQEGDPDPELEAILDTDFFSLKPIESGEGKEVTTGGQSQANVPSGWNTGGGAGIHAVSAVRSEAS